MTATPPLPAAEYRFWACDLRTGNKVAQLPLKPTGALPDRISDVGTTVFACDQAAVLRDGGDFIGVTTPGRTLIVVEREYAGDSTSDILWAGIVTARDAGSDAEATLNCATVGSYFGRRDVGTHTYLGGPGDTDDQIIADLLADAAPEGLGFILDTDCPTVRAVKYLDAERKKVLACLKDLSDMEGGPEWRIVTRWKTEARLAVEHVFLARPRLGWAGSPNIRFDYPGCINKYNVTDDYTEGHGANHIRAVDSNGGGSAPARDTQGITSQGWPRWEEDVETSGDLDAAGLTGVAKETLTKRARGQATASIAVSLTYGPQYGRDWVLGDNALWFVAGPETPGAESPSPRHPDGHSEVIRVIGVALDIGNDTLTPALWNPYDEETTD
ncbi:hypothetical protein ACFPJ1_40745 [Kribbella qitaiheensis]|uniref:hypothetical protein n=1 Tax=Kribbella qitaiheensis TaxID=1544730 RepID=UPI00361FBFED